MDNVTRKKLIEKSVVDGVDRRQETEREIRGIHPGWAALFMILGIVLTLLVTEVMLPYKARMSLQIIGKNQSAEGSYLELSGAGTLKVDSHIYAEYDTFDYITFTANVGRLTGVKR